MTLTYVVKVTLLSDLEKIFLGGCCLSKNYEVLKNNSSDTHTHTHTHTHMRGVQGKTFGLPSAPPPVNKVELSLQFTKYMLSACVRACVCVKLISHIKFS